MDYKYIFLDVYEIAIIDFSQVIEDSIDTIRYSNDKEKTFLKYDGEMPSSLNSLTTKSVEYNIEEMLEILSTDANWADPVEP